MGDVGRLVGSHTFPYHEYCWYVLSYVDIQLPSKCWQNLANTEFIYMDLHGLDMKSQINSNHNIYIYIYYMYIIYVYYICILYMYIIYVYYICILYIYTSFEMQHINFQTMCLA